MTRRSPPHSAEARLVDFVTSHAERERETLAGYRRLARELPSPAFRYLARLIVADEERHHEILADLGQTVFAFDDLRAPGMPLPPATTVARDADRQAVLAKLDAFAEAERQEREDLERLGSELPPGPERALWSLLVQLMHEDTERHLRLLGFMRDQLADHPPDGPGRPARGRGGTSSGTTVPDRGVRRVPRGR